MLHWRLQRMLNEIALSTFVTLGGWSTHFSKCGEKTGKDCEYNESHQMIMADHKGLTVGTFKNSYHKTSRVLGYTFRKNRYSVLGGIG